MSFTDFADPQLMQGPTRPLLRFEETAVEVPGKTAIEGRPIYENRDHVTITYPGARDEVYKAAKDAAAKDPYIRAAYEQWKLTKEQPVDGTPLNTVPFLTPAQIKELQSLKILSLENLAGLSDGQAQRCGFDGMTLRDKARVYMKAAKDTALATKLQGELAARDREIDMLKKQIEKINARFEAEVGKKD